MHLIETIDNYIKNRLIEVFSQFIVFSKDNLKIYEKKGGNISIDMYFPADNNDNIEIVKVHWAIEELKNAFPDVTIDFNYLVGSVNEDRYEIPKYTIQIHYSAEDQCYIAHVPDVKHCYELGNTRDEALKKCEKKLNMYIDSTIDKGMMLPQINDDKIPVLTYTLAD